MQGATNAIKKCSHCGKYSGYNGELYARCEHCNNLLDELAVKEHETYEEEKHQARLRYEHPVFWVSIKPGDNLIKRIWKRFLIGFQVVYFAVVSFLVWVAAVIAG